MNNNPNVTDIPARYRVTRQEQDEDKPKLRVAAYCRVSTDSEEQTTSYEAQIEHYTGIFADKGLPVLTFANAGEFNRRPGNTWREN